MKNTSPKEIKVDTGLYNDYKSNERTKDTSQSPTSDNSTGMGKKDDIDFDNCDVYIKKPVGNTRQRSAYKFLEESFTGSTVTTSSKPTINSQFSNLENNKSSKVLFSSDIKGSPENNSNLKNDKMSNEMFCSRRKNKVTKTLDNNDFEF